MGKRYQKCFDCGESGHFKEASSCKKPRDKNKNKQKDSANTKKDKKGQLKRVQVKTLSDEDSEDSDDTLTDSTCRAKEKFCRPKQSKVVEPTALISIKPREGGEYADVGWFPDSGVYRIIITESLYRKLLKTAPQMKLRENRVNFTTYGAKHTLPVMGRVKLVLKNANGFRVKSMIYVEKGGQESLLG